MKAALVSGPQAFSKISGGGVEIEFAGDCACQTEILDCISVCEPHLILTTHGR